jgi:hypothetical protein
MKKLFALLAILALIGTNVSFVEAKGTKCSSKEMTPEKKARKTRKTKKTKKELPA